MSIFGLCVAVSFGLGFRTFPGLDAKPDLTDETSTWEVEVWGQASCHGLRNFG